MPKGVEHTVENLSKHFGLLVRIPMMPKGVEHKLTHFCLLPIFLVRIPMMPKGVEHSFAVHLSIAVSRENSDDAERR